MVPVVGRGGVPLVSASAVAVNVTVTNANSAGFLTVWPCGEPMPLASTLNYATGDTVANGAIAKLGSSGDICLYSYSATHVIVDVNGWFPAGAELNPLTPSRLADTRPGGSTVDGSLAGTNTVGANATLVVPVAGRGGVGASATSAALNITVTATQNAGFLTVWPCGEAMPNASSLNYGPGDTRANSVITKLGSDGDVCVFASAPTQLLVDVAAWFSAASSYRPLVPARLTDTRPGATTIDGRDAGVGTVAAGGVVTVATAGRGQVPASGVSAAVLNITVTQASDAGFLTVWPCGEPMPNASTLNYAKGDTIANGAIAKLGSSGSVCVFSMAAAHVIVDVAGWFPTPTTVPPVIPPPTTTPPVIPPPTTTPPVTTTPTTTPPNTEFAVNEVDEETAVFVDAAAITTYQPDGTSVIHYTGSEPLNMDKIFVESPSVEHPEGLIGRIESITDNADGSSTVVTSPGIFSDVIPVYDFTIDAETRSLYLADETQPQPIQAFDQGAQLAEQGPEFSPQSQSAASDDDDPFSVSCSAGAQFTPDLDVVTSGFTRMNFDGDVLSRNPHTEVSMNPQLTVTIDIPAALALECSANIDFELVNVPFVVPLGPVPIPMTYVAGVFVQGSLALSVGSEPNTQVLTAGGKIGARYSALNGAELINDFAIGSDPGAGEDVEAGLELSLSAGGRIVVGAGRDAPKAKALIGISAEFGVTFKNHVPVDPYEVNPDNGSEDCRSGSYYMRYSWGLFVDFSLVAEVKIGPWGSGFEVMLPGMTYPKDGRGFTVSCLRNIVPVDASLAAPTGLRADPGHRSVILEWSPSGDARVEGYLIQVRNIAEQRWETIHSLLGGDRSSAVLSSLVNGQTYQYRVAAYYDDSATNRHSGTPSADATATPYEDDWSVAAITALAATPDNGTALLAWDVSANINVFGYLVERLAPNGTWKFGRFVTGRATRTVSIDGLQNYQRYTFRVRAYTVDGAKRFVGLSGAGVAAIPFELDATMPTPAGLTATWGDEQVVLRWTPVTDARTSGYEIKQYNAASGEWETAHFAIGRTARTFTVTGLNNYRDYSFEIRSFRGSQATRAVSELTATVSADPHPVLKIVTASLRRENPGVEYSEGVFAVGGRVEGGPYIYTIIGGALPDGLTMTPDGRVTGVVEAAVDGYFTVQATAPDGEPVAKSISYVFALPDRYAGHSYRILGYGEPGFLGGYPYKEGEQAYFSPLTDTTAVTPGAPSVTPGVVSVSYATVSTTSTGELGVDETYRLIQIGSDGLTRTLAGGGSYSDPSLGSTTPTAHPSAVGLKIIPKGQIVVRDGKVLFFDYLADAIIEVDPETLAWRELLGGGTGTYVPGDGLRDFALRAFTTMAIAADGTLYFTDGVGPSATTGPRLLALGATGPISVVAGNGTSTYTGDDGQATSAGLSMIESLSVDNPGGRILMVVNGGQGQTNDRVRAVNLRTGALTTVLGATTAACPTTARQPIYTTPSLEFCGTVAAVAAAPDGDVYVSLGASAKLYRVATSLEWVAGMSSANGRFALRGATFANTELYFTSSLAFSATGDLYVSTRIYAQVGVLAGVDAPNP